MRDITIIKFDMMNESNFKPQRTDKFTPQQDWEFKMEKRLKRLDKIENRF